MAIEIRSFSVTIPAGTAVSAGFSADMSFPARIVTEIHVRVPPGPRGEVGFAVGTGGIPIVPYGPAAWIVTDDEDLVFPLDDTIQSGAWQLLGYNTGAYPHTLRVYFHCSLLSATAGAGGGTLLPPGSLGSGTGGDTGGGSGTGTGGGGSGGGIGVPIPVPPGGGGVTVPTPLFLPPALPSLGGQGSAGPVPVPSLLLVAVGDAGTVGLLGAGGYWPLAAQADVDGLIAAGVGGVQGSAGFDHGLRAAFPVGEAGTSAGAGTGTGG